jgi:hypothetical protein
MRSVRERVTGFIYMSLPYLPAFENLLTLVRLGVKLKLYADPVD